MKRIKLIIFSTLILLFTVISAQSQVRQHVPAIPHPVSVEQPNGDTITIRIFGDERGSYRTTIDGYVIIENSKGYYCYAKLNRKNEIVASLRKVDALNERSWGDRRYLKKMAKKPELYRPKK